MLSAQQFGGSGRAAALELYVCLWVYRYFARCLPYAPLPNEGVCCLSPRTPAAWLVVRYQRAPVVNSELQASDPYGRDMEAGRQGTVGEIGLETGEAAYLLDSQRKNE